MLKLIYDLPPQVVGMHAYADVTEQEYEGALIPLFNDVINKNRRISFLLVLETDIKNFASGAWCGNVRIGLKYFFKWNKIAIVTDQRGVLGYSDLFKYIVPGKFKCYRLDQLDSAIKWISRVTEQ